MLLRYVDILHNCIINITQKKRSTGVPYNNHNMSNRGIVLGLGFMEVGWGFGFSFPYGLVCCALVEMLTCVKVLGLVLMKGCLGCWGWMLGLCVFLWGVLQFFLNGIEFLL